jgi:hypothetical protein
LVVLNRKHSEVSKTVKIMSEYNRTDMAGLNPSRIHTDFLFLRCLPIQMLVYGKIKGIPPRLQFLGLPLDVKSLERVSGLFFEKFAF